MLVKILKKFLIILIFSAIFIANNIFLVKAEEGDNMPVKNLDTFISSADTGFASTKKTPAEIVGGVLNNFYILLGIIIFVLVVYAGVNWLFAMGNEEKVTESLKIIKHAVIGLVILFSAYLITAFIINTVSGI